MHHVVHFAIVRRRLLTALLVGATIALILPQPLRAMSRILIGWNIGVWGYLMLLGRLMVSASPARVKKIAAQENTGAIAVLVIMSIAATLSIAAIVIELASMKQATRALRFEHYLFTGTTVLGSWLLLVAIYTFHYARLFYQSPASHRPLRFPNDEHEPVYWDFLYFSFTIAVAAQTSDVSVMSRSMRKAVMAQSVLSFFFNVAIIGMSINITASMLGMR
jgi:uncharacterized membrane protein